MTIDSADSIPVDHGAWMTPGVFPISDGIWRLPLPLPMPDLSCVNAWVLQDGQDMIVVDPGWASAESEIVLRDGLASLDIQFSDISQIIATHTHWDHYSEAIKLRDEYGTPVFIGRDEHFSVDAYRTGDAFFGKQSDRLFMCGASVLARTIANLPPESWEVDVPFGQPTGWLEHAQRMPLGDSEIVVYVTPGHTRGHVVVSKPDSGVLLTGDHILPRITPSIGLELRPEAFPLRSFLGSLALVKSLPDAEALPAHGNVAPSVHRRADELLEHHESRFDAVADRLKGGPDTVMGVASRMKWTRRERDLTDLIPVHQMAAVLEIAAHLDVLEQRGQVSRETIDRVDYFSMA